MSLPGRLSCPCPPLNVLLFVLLPKAFAHGDDGPALRVDCCLGQGGAVHVHQPLYALHRADRCVMKGQQPPCQVRSDGRGGHAQEAQATGAGAGMRLRISRGAYEFETVMHAAVVETVAAAHGSLLVAPPCLRAMHAVGMHVRARVWQVRDGGQWRRRRTCIGEPVDVDRQLNGKVVKIPAAQVAAAAAAAAAVRRDTHRPATAKVLSMLQ